MTERRKMWNILKAESKSLDVFGRVIVWQGDIWVMESVALRGLDEGIWLAEALQINLIDYNYFVAAGSCNHPLLLELSIGLLCGQRHLLVSILLFHPLFLTAFHPSYRLLVTSTSLLRTFFVHIILASSSPPSPLSQQHEGEGRCRVGFVAYLPKYLLTVFIANIWDVFFFFSFLTCSCIHRKWETRPFFF